MGTRSSTALKSTQTSTHTNSQLVQRMSLPRQSSSAYTYYLTYQCTTTILISLFREWESCQRELKRERERELHLYAFGPKLVSLYPGAIFRLKIYMTDSLSLSLSLSHLVTHTHCKHTLPPSPLSLSLSVQILSHSLYQRMVYLGRLCRLTICACRIFSSKSDLTQKEAALLCFIQSDVGTMNSSKRYLKVPRKGNI